MTDNRDSKERLRRSVRARLLEKAERAAVQKGAGSEEDPQPDHLKLAQELETAYVELEAQNEELRASSRRLEAARSEFWELYEYAPVGYVSLGRKGLVQNANLAARRMLTGREDEPLAGVAFSNFVAPQDLSAYFKRFRSKEPGFLELRFSNTARETFYVHCRMAPKFERRTRLTGWQLAFFDISEQKRLESRLRENSEHLELATSAGGIGIWIGDLQTGQAHWNGQLFLLLGLPPRPGPERRDYFLEFIHPLDRPLVMERLQQAVDLEKGTIDLEFRIIRKDDGRVRWLKSKGGIDRDEKGRPVRIRGVNYDITSRREAQEQARVNQKKLTAQLAATERINEELSQYAYAVSHDLKGPLRAIRNYAEFLLEDMEGRLSGDEKEYLLGLKTAVGQADALVNDLLSFSRVGRVPLEVEAIDVPALIDEIRLGLDLGPEVKMDVSPQWPQLRVDRSLLRQILQNLITNAVKFNERNPKRVVIGCRTGPGESVEIFVEDNGIGIEAEYHDQIFRIFQRLHSSRNYEGTGIGLAIVQKAAQRMGGGVRIESEPGEGSTFYLRLPKEMEDHGSNHAAGYEI